MHSDRRLIKLHSLFSHYYCCCMPTFCAISCTWKYTEGEEKWIKNVGWRGGRCNNNLFILPILFLLILHVLKANWNFYGQWNQTKKKFIQEICHQLEICHDSNQPSRIQKVSIWFEFSILTPANHRQADLFCHILNPSSS